MHVLIGLSLLGCAFAAVPRSGSRIVGGEPTFVERYPYIANVQHGLFGILWYPNCGGTLITSTSVLSAAHCFEEDIPPRYRALLGSSFVSSGGIVHTVHDIISHERYAQPVLDNDVAIMKLVTPAIFSERIQPARVAGPRYILPDDSVVYVAGWGALEFRGPSPEQLHHVAVHIINQELCAERYAYLKTQPGYERWPDVSDGMICSGILDVGGKDGCQGDSGGPLIHRGDIVVGITSWGFECADEFYPGVSARVSYYSDWIVANS